MKVHDFKTCLRWSELQSDEPFWQEVYRKAFPDLVVCASTAAAGKSALQTQGVDRYIVLKSGRELRIDEKKRGKKYDDFLLEYISNDKTRSPGWMNKPLRIDFLAYAFMTDRRVYLLQWDILRRAWLHYKAEWIRKYGTKEAQNRGYKTLSVPVPIHVVQNAIRTAGIIDIQLPVTAPLFQRRSTTTAIEQGLLFEATS